MLLNYEILGNGTEPLLVFHGIGQTGKECFSAFERELGSHFKICAFDLPFHGGSAPLFQADRWDRGNEPVSPEEWRAFLAGFLSEQGISRFSIAGFSLGGRFALATLDLFFDRIDKAFLIAPDGVIDQPIYRLATGSRMMRGAFFSVMKRRKALQRFAGMLQNLGLIHISVTRVLNRLTASDEHALLVFRSWVNLRKLKASGEFYRKDSSVFEGKVFLFLGKYDHLVKERDVSPLLRKLDRSQVIWLNSGHTTSVDATAAEIRRIEQV